MGGRELLKPEAPVLCETHVEKKLREDKAEYKEKKLLALKEKRMQDAGHVKPDFNDKAFELELRRMATKGVVRLFNTVQDFQSRDHEMDSRHRMGKVNVKRRSKEMAEDAKGAFQQMWSSRDKAPPR